MKKLGRKITLGVAGLLAIGCVAVGGKALDGGANIFARAEDNATMTVDTLGNLEWAETSGATGYNWNYTIGGTTSATYFAEDNEVNVGIALTKAAQAAIAANNADDDTTNDVAASVQFSVTPVLETGVGAEMIYTHTFTQYIDYGYATHDFADVKAQAKYPTRLSELTLDGTLDYWIPSAMFKNDILTLGMRADAALNNNGIDFSLFGGYKDKDSRADYNYRIMTREDGEIFVAIKTKYNGAWYKRYNNKNGNLTQKKLNVGVDYYFSMAVFDTYDLTGAVVGETLYYTRSDFDETANALHTLDEISLFVDSATLTTKKVSYKTDNVKLSSGTRQSMQVDRAGMLIYADGANSTTFVFSGIPNYDGLEAPTGVYYDNADATMNWNAVAGATAYEWKVGDGAWTRINARKVSVESYLTEYKTIGHLPFSVRAVDGKATTYNLDLHRFYNARSKVVDYIDLHKTKTSGNKVTYPTTLSGSYTPSGYMADGTELTMGTHTTFKMKITQAASYNKVIAYIALWGEADVSYHNKYFMALFGDGDVRFVNTNSAESYPTGTKAAKDKYWNITNVVDGFAFGKIYYVTYGVDAVYETDADGNEVQVAERITARFEIEEGDGCVRRTLSVISFDNEMFETDGYVIEKNPVLQFKNNQTYTEVYRAIGDTNHTIEFLVDDEQYATKEVDYGSYYNFNDVQAPSADAIPEGYAFGGWVFTNTKGKEKPFALEGHMTVPIADEITVNAKFVPITYTVSYNVDTDNETAYTIESDWTLKGVQSNSTNLVFDAWYEKTDTEFANPITTLNGMTGNLELVARFVNGYTVTVITDSEETAEKYYFKADGTDEVQLVAPAIENKTFVGWKKLVDGEYKDYNGLTSYVPQNSATYKAEYEWTKYSLTYVTGENVTHTNPLYYTVNEPLSLAKATKVGGLFVGWYLDADYTTMVTDTDEYADNITLYARFIENSLPTQDVAINRNKTAVQLPVPTLPDGASYTVALSKAGVDLPIYANEYSFNDGGEYTLRYTISLSTGEEVVHEVTYDVSAVYYVTIHYENGETLVLEKALGDTVLESEIPEVETGYRFGGLYTDSEYTQEYDVTSTIADDTDVYVKRILVETVNKQPVAGAVIGVVVGVVVGIGCVAVYLFMTKKKRNVR